MRLLVIGGTEFVGRHVVLSARAAGMEVTLFNRGRTNPELFSDLERLRGDRTEDLSALEGRRWDAVVDTSGYTPQALEASAAALADACEHYTFVSTVSVYEPPGEPGIDETAPLHAPQWEGEEVTPETYGPLKVACEQVVGGVLGPQALIVRPGVVAGPHDPTDRFTYWASRAARGGEILCPEPRDGHVQFIDVRDLADWIVSCALAGTTGTFNATGDPVTMERLITSCVDGAGVDARLVWVDGAELVAEGVRPWVDLPGWMGPDRDDFLMRVDSGRAKHSGLALRPLSDTARATMRWAEEREPGERGAGLPAEREQEVLERRR